VVRALKKVAHHDWKHSHPLDLTDEGLLEELKKHKIDAASELALEGANRRVNRKK
jgi:cardiolipin synthase A/B